MPAKKHRTKCVASLHAPVKRTRPRHKMCPALNAKSFALAKCIDPLKIPLACGGRPKRAAPGGTKVCMEFRTVMQSLHSLIEFFNSQNYFPARDRRQRDWRVDSLRRTTTSTPSVPSQETTRGTADSLIDHSI
jgi:hypothetical protein